MPPLIENPADCEVRVVIRFLSAKGSKAAEIHRQISEVYGESVMRDGMVRKWVRAFSNGRTNIHDEERSGRPSVIIDDLIEKVDCLQSTFSIMNRLFSFTRVKENRHLAGQRHNNHDEVKMTVLQWLSHQAATFFEDGIQKLVPRYDKCLNINGNYVEK
ncbi:protein GVQW3-like [Centruroides vittatus]|uniref:protein GVQW3-like n=1 Tax=Centruroides vittatus TaxID=120091 RepID=UPI00350F2718